MQVTQYLCSFVALSCAQLVSSIPPSLPRKPDHAGVDDDSWLTEGSGDIGTHWASFQNSQGAYLDDEDMGSGSGMEPFDSDFGVPGFVTSDVYPPHEGDLIIQPDIKQETTPQSHVVHEKPRDYKTSDKYDAKGDAGSATSTISSACLIVTIIMMRLAL